MGDTHSYSLVSGTGADDNASFNISGNALRLTGSANFEAKTSYTVRVRSTDQGGLLAEQDFTITVNDINESPTDISLSANSIVENNAPDATVGTLSAIGDPDAGATHSFSFVAGTGDADNAAFTIDGSTLKIIGIADSDIKSSYSLRVQANDGVGGSFAKVFTVSVTDVNDNTPSVSTAPTKYLVVGGGVNNTNAVRLLRLNGAGTAIASSAALPSNTSGSMTYMTSYNPTSGQMILGNSYFHLPTYLSSGTFTLNTNGGIGNNSPWQAHLPSGKFLTPRRNGTGNAPVQTFDPAANTITDGGTHGAFIPEASWIYNNELYTLSEGLGMLRTPIAANGSTSGAMTAVSPNPITTMGIPHGDNNYTETSRLGIDPADGTALLLTGHQHLYLFDLDGPFTSGGYITRNIHNFITTSSGGFTYNPTFTEMRGAVYDAHAGVFYVSGALNNGSVTRDFIVRVTKAGNVTPVAQEILGDAIYSDVNTNGFSLAFASATSNTFTVAENSANGTSVGTAAGSDPDAGTAFSNWTITSGNTDGAFAIDANTGAITVANGAALNYESTLSYSLGLTVSDGTTTSAEGFITINLSNVNEAPTDITLSPSSIEENNAANATVGTLSATDVDAGATHSFTLVSGTGSTDNASFTIVGTDLKITPSADFETKASYNLRVRANDGLGLTFDKELTVTITNVLESLIAMSESGNSLIDDLTTIDYGTVLVGANLTKTFTIHSIGDGPLSITNIAIDGPQAAEFTTDTTGTSNTIAAGGSTTFTVRFSPTAVNTRQAFLRVTSNDPRVGTLDLGLTGFGNNAPIVSVPIAAVTAIAPTPAGTPVTFSVSATDPEDGTLTPTLSHASGSTFPVGDTVVTASATDSAGTTTTRTFTVSVSPTIIVTAAITSPVEGAQVANSTTGVKIEGTASATATAVSISINGGAPIPTTVTTITGGKKWSITTTALRAANNTIVATATNGVFSSPSAPRTFFYKALRPLAINLLPSSAAGTVTISPALVSGNGVVGNTYSLKAVAATGYFFKDWSGKPTGTTTTTSFVFAEGDTVTGNFEASSFTGDVRGTYVGVVAGNSPATNTQANSGLLRVVISHVNGSFTGSYRLNGTGFPISGTLSNGVGTDPVRRYASATVATGISVNLVLDTSQSIPTISGTLTRRNANVTTAVITGTAIKAFDAETRPTALAGEYNVAFSVPTSVNSLPAANFPSGNGFAQVTIYASNGQATVRGTLADGITFTSSGSVGLDGSLPMVASLSAFAGAVVGTLKIDTAAATTDITGTDISWFQIAGVRNYYPAGYGTGGLRIGAVGTRRPVPANVVTELGLGTADTINLSGGPISAPVAVTVGTSTVSAASQVCTSANRKTSITITRSTGLITGFHIPVTPASQHSIKGIVISKGGTAEAYGHILTPATLSAGGVGLGGLVDIVP
jgi:hypothetical protein